MRLLIAVCLCLLPRVVLAQGWIEPLPRPLPRPQAASVERVRTSVTVRVTDRVAHVRVEEWFRNTGTGLGEGDYIYPLPGEAVFSDFGLMMGEEELRGETMDAARARSIYEDIVRRHRDPALIELAGNGLVRARIFPIAPGETRSITLRYTQVLSRSGDAYRFRYVAGAARSSGPRATSPQPGAPLSFTLVAEDGGRFGEPFSLTHRLRVSRDGQRLIVRPEQELDGPVDLFLPLASAAIGITVATHRVDGEDGYFMLTLSPGRVRGTGTPAPRDVAVVVDTSGSMSGEKMEQARQALHRLLRTLNASDRFRIIAFSNRVEAQQPGWTEATATAVAEARGWVDRLDAGGGTNIGGGLDEAFRVPSDPGRLHLAIVITDGLPTVGLTDPDQIAARVEANRGDARIFAFGVGYDLHTYLLERVAVAGRGTVEYVEPGADVEEAVGSLASKITHPVLVDLAIAGSPARLMDLQPARLPDLYAGEELVVLGRYRSAGGSPAGELAIAGQRGGRTERFAALVEFPTRAAAADYIPRLWASRKIGELMRTIRVEGETPERVREVRELALRFGVVTEYTSYLVQEPQLRGGVPFVPAAAPATVVTGQAAVASARLAAVRREARTAADLAVAERVAAAGGLAPPASENEQLVAGRRFRRIGDNWVDIAHGPSTRIVHIAPFSRAWFDVLERLPELRPYAQTFDAVTVGGQRVAIRLASGGLTTIAAAELNKIAIDFRGGPVRP